MFLLILVDYIFVANLLMLGITTYDMTLGMD
jgi:hypothetical protein